MKSYVPKLKPVPVKALRCPKGLTVAPGDYLVIYPDGKVAALPAERFEALYAPGEKSKRRRREKSSRDDLLIALGSDKDGAGLTANEIATLMGNAPKGTVSGRLADLRKEGLIEIHPNAKPSRYRLTAEGHKYV